MKNKSKEIIFLSSAIIALCGFIAILIMLKVGYNFKIDGLNVFLYEHQTNFWTGFFKVVTYFGEWWVIFLIGVLVTIFSKDRKVGWVSLIAAVTAALLCVSVKYIVRRPRPEMMLIHEIGFSFPSAHTMISLAFYGVLIYFVNKKIRNMPCRIVFSILLSILILTVSFSRIYLNVHFCSDVLAGVLFGYVAIYIAIQLGKLIFKPKPSSQILNQQD